MRDLHIRQTLSTPEIIFNRNTSTFSIDGPILTNEAEQFFSPVMDWLDDYSEFPNENTKVHFKIEYFDISCGKRILFILYKLREIIRSGKKVMVHWHYDPTNYYMLEIGEDFAMMMYDIPFHFVAEQ